MRSAATIILPETAAPDMMAAPDDPIYVRILAQLQARIDRGTYPVASYLPTEAQLGAEFGTSRHTIREALRRLAEQGLIRRRAGAGTIVVSATRHSRYVQSFTSLSELFQTALDTHYVLHSITPIVLDATLAELAGGAAGQDWLHIIGMRWTALGGMPLAFIDSYVPKDLGPIVAGFPGAQMPFYDLLEKASGRIIENVFQEIRSVEMPQNVADSFGLPSGSSALQLLRRYVTRQGVLIASCNWHRGDQFTYRMQIARQAPASPA